MKTYYKCPYQHEYSCDKISPDGYLNIQCSDCENYDKGIMETGGISKVLAIVILIGIAGLIVMAVLSIFKAI